MKKILYAIVLTLLALLTACGTDNKQEDAINEEIASEICEITIGESSFTIDFADDRATYEPAMLT